MPAIVLFILLSLIPAAAASPTFWQIDPVHTRVMIAVDHAGFSKAMAIVSVEKGELRWDPAQPEDAEVSVQMAPALLDFGDSKWNKAVHGSSFLHSERFPRARYRSTRVTALADGQLLIEGELTLRDITAPVTLQAQVNGQRRHPLPPFTQTVGFSATGSLSRHAFGINAWPSLIGDTVELRIEVEATRLRHHSDATATSEPTS